MPNSSFDARKEPLVKQYDVSAVDTLIAAADRAMPFIDILSGLDGADDAFMGLRDALASFDLRGVKAAKNPVGSYALVKAFDARFGNQVEDDAEINGADAVDWISEFAPLVRAYLRGDGGEAA